MNWGYQNIDIDSMLFGHCFGCNPLGIDATRHKVMVSVSWHVSNSCSASAGAHPSIMIDLISCNGRHPGQIRLGDRRK